VFKWRRKRNVGSSHITYIRTWEGWLYLRDACRNVRWRPRYDYRDIGRPRARMWISVFAPRSVDLCVVDGSVPRSATVHPPEPVSISYTLLVCI